MATVPPPDSMPETPPMNPGGVPDEVTTPGPDVDVPDRNPSDPGDQPDSPPS